MLKTGICILFIYCCPYCQAQSDSIIKPSNSHFNLKLSSGSSVIYPGVSTGIEFPLHPYNCKGLITKPDNRSYYKCRFISGNLSWYHHPGFHDNLYFTAEIVMRRTRQGGFFSEFSFGPGYSRTFIAGTTYKENENGDISVVKHAGYSYAVITFGGGFGYDFSLKKQIPVSVFSKMNLLSMFPYNSTIYIRPVLELGFRYFTGRNCHRK